MFSKKFLRLVSVILLSLMCLVGCQKKEAANKQVIHSRQAWYLYQGGGNNPKNIMRLRFYGDKTVSVQNVNLMGNKKGYNILNKSFTNPDYHINEDGEEIIIDTTHPKMVFAVKDSYKGTAGGYRMQGYEVTYQGQKWHLGQIKSQNKKQVQKYRKQSKVSSHVIKKRSDQLSSNLMDNLQPKPEKANSVAAIRNRNIAGEYNYRAQSGLNRVYGRLTVTPDGEFTNTMYIHDKQNKKNPDVDNPVMAKQQTMSGYLESAYGKLYFRPLNLLTIKYFTTNQNPENPAIDRISLDTNSKKYGKNIRSSRYRLELHGDHLLLYNDDLRIWADDKQESVDVDGIQLYKTDQPALSLKEQYQQIYEHYEDLKRQPIKSNKDLRQYVGIIASENDSAIAGLGINLSGKFSVTQSVDNFIGIDHSGERQVPMQYLTMLEPAVMQEKKSSKTISTEAGQFLVFGYLDNNLYLLQQPDSDSQTITWTKFKNLPVKLPLANVTLNH